jgi:hypothetical protein
MKKLLGIGFLFFLAACGTPNQPVEPDKGCLKESWVGPYSIKLSIGIPVYSLENKKVDKND